MARKKTEPNEARRVNNVALAVVENGIANKANVDAITDRELKKTANTLYTLAISAKRNLFSIAVILKEVDDSKSYEKAGFTSVFQFANAVCGYGKPMVYNLIQIANKFTVVERDENGKVTGVHSEFIDNDGNDFSVSQLQEMKALESDDAKKLVDGGAISKDMTTKKIRNVVKAYNDGRVEFDENGKATVKEAEKEETETAENEENEIDASVAAVIDILGALDTLYNDSRISTTNKAALTNIRNTINMIAKNDLGAE